MNICARKNSGWAEDGSFKYAGGLGMGAFGNTNKGLGNCLGNQYNVTNPLVTPPAAPSPVVTPASVYSDTNGGLCCNVVCDVNTSACTMMDKTAQQWAALKASVDNILYGTATICATPTATSAKQSGVDVQKSTKTFYIVAGIGAGVLILTGIILAVTSKKGK